MLRVKESVKHQGIGGKEFVPDFEVSAEEVAKKANECNWACRNFCGRRKDFSSKFDKKLYYGHVGVLGYVICKDELEGDLEELAWCNNDK